MSPYVSNVAANLAYDATVTTGGSSAAVPTTASPVTEGSLTYSVYKYIECFTASTNGSCLTSSIPSSASTATPVNYLRAVVAVVWTQHGCPANTCGYTSSTLLSSDADPTFDTNQALPAAPLVQNPGAQTVEVGDTVALQLLVQNNTGVAPFSWTQTGTWPSWLVMSPTGLISSTPGAVPATAATTSVGVTVYDAFGRAATATISFTVYPQLTFTVPNQTNVTTDSVNLALAASGGKSGYTYAATTALPAGLTLSGSSITGTPSTPGTTTVKITATDSAAHSVTSTFTWAVAYPPLGITNPPAQTSDVSTADSLQMAASGGDGAYMWSATGLPGGLSINASTGLISGTPTTAGTTSVTVTVTDAAVTPSTKQATFSWTVYAKPTITTPATQTTSKTGTASLSVASSCPNASCTYTATGLPSGLSINSATGVIAGTVSTSATTSTTVRVTVTDAAGVAATTATFTWTINAAPVITSPGDQLTTQNTTVSLALAGNVSGGTSPYTYSASGLPAWLSINAGTGVISGKSPTANSVTTGIRVTVTDKSGAVTTTAAFAWRVSNLALAVPNFTLAKGTSVSQGLTGYASGGSTPYSFTAANLPTGLSLSGSTITGTVSVKGTWTATFTVTDSAGASVSDTSTITVN